MTIQSNHVSDLWSQIWICRSFGAALALLQSPHCAPGRMDEQRDLTRSRNWWFLAFSHKALQRRSHDSKLHNKSLFSHQCPPHQNKSMKVQKNTKRDLPENLQKYWQIHLKTFQNNSILKNTTTKPFQDMDTGQLHMYHLLNHQQLWQCFIIYHTFSY